MLLNWHKSTITVCYVEINARPLAGLSFTASATDLDAKGKYYTGSIGSQAMSGVLVADLASFKGVRLPYAPKLQYSFRADYDTEITPELAGFVGVGVNGQSKSYSDRKSTRLNSSH